MSCSFMFLQQIVAFGVAFVVASGVALGVALGVELLGASLLGVGTTPPRRKSRKS